MICYSDTELKSPGGAIHVDPTKAYLRHYDNYLYLQFLSRKSPNPRERGQALRELTICERKLKFHEREADKTQMLLGVQQLRRSWLQPRSHMKST